MIQPVSAVCGKRPVVYHPQRPGLDEFPSGGNVPPHIRTRHLGITVGEVKHRADSEQQPHQRTTQIQRPHCTPDYRTHVLTRRLPVPFQARRVITFDEVQGAALGFLVGACHVLADDAAADQLHAAQEQDDDDK